MEEKNQMSINISPEVASGKYSNLAVISHSRSEFTLDFAQTLPGIQGANVASRIIMTPENCKKLLMALSENISKYEAMNGTIQLEREAKGTFNLNDFNPGGTRS